MSTLNDSIFLVKREGAFGTAFIFAETDSSFFLATCAHVVSDQKQVLIGRTHMPAEVIWKSSEDVLDLAFLRVDRHLMADAKPLSISPILQPDLSIMAIGYLSHGRDRVAKKPTHGILESFFDMESRQASGIATAWQGRFKGDEEVQGFSGSPVFELQNMTVIGWITERKSTLVYGLSVKNLIDSSNHLPNDRRWSVVPPDGYQVESREKSLRFGGNHAEPEWPPIDVNLQLHEERNKIYLNVIFNRNFPGKEDTHDSPVQIPIRKGDLLGRVSALLSCWRRFMDDTSKNELEIVDAGTRLYAEILGPFGGVNREVGIKLKGLRGVFRDPAVRIRITTKNVFLPWHLLFIPDVGFLGERHFLQTSVKSRYVKAMGTRSQLNLFRFGELPFIISQQIENRLIEHQESLKFSLSRYSPADVRVENRNDLRLLSNALSGEVGDQLMYFSFLHNLNWSRVGKNKKKNLLVDFGVGNERFDVEKLRGWLSYSSLSYDPVLFLNLCAGPNAPDGLELISHYDGFHDEFFAAGASGFIGPEVPVSPAFAAAFASEFVNQLLSGNSDPQNVHRTITDALLATKQVFSTKGDRRGLVYSYFLVKEVAFPHVLTKNKPPTSASNSEGKSETLGVL